MEVRVIDKPEPWRHQDTSSYLGWENWKGETQPPTSKSKSHHRDRAVTHMLDTTGMPVTPIISAVTTNLALNQIDPVMLLEFVCQRQQQQQQQTLETHEQKPVLTVKQRLGPLTTTTIIHGGRCQRRNGVRISTCWDEDSRITHKIAAKGQPTDTPVLNGQARRWPQSNTPELKPIRVCNRLPHPVHHRPACNRHYNEWVWDKDQKKESVNTTKVRRRVKLYISKTWQTTPTRRQAPTIGGLRSRPGSLTRQRKEWTGRNAALYPQIDEIVFAFLQFSKNKYYSFIFYCISSHFSLFL